MLGKSNIVVFAIICLLPELCLLPRLTFCDVIICHWAMRLSAYSLFVSSAPAQLVLWFSLCIIYLSVLGMHNHSIFESQ